MAGQQHHGKCLCGAVRVTARIAKQQVDACHCDMCRTWGGGPLFAVDGGTEATFTGEEHIRTFASSDWAERGFCDRCGTHLFYRLTGSGQVMLPAGLLDDADWSFTHQIFVDEKPAWYTFADSTENLTGEQVFAQFAGDSD